LLVTLDSGKSARGLDFNSLERDILKDTPLLSMKPIIYAANISENDVGKDIDVNTYYNQVKKHAQTENAEIIPICASIEAEISELEKDEKNVFLEEMGIAESGLDKLIKASYNLLGLISFLTAGPKEVRAWTIKSGTKAPQAAGKIHTDFERGFIRAEVIAFNDLTDCGGNMVTAKEKGLIRSEGKEYLIKDGDVVLFRFNV